MEMLAVKCLLHQTYLTMFLTMLCVQKRNLFDFLPDTNTSSVLVSQCSLCRVEAPSSCVQFHIQWVAVMNFPTVVALLLLGHIICSGFLHNLKSEWVGCSFVQRIDDCRSPLCRRDPASLSILQPNAVSISDINKTCCKTRTRLSLLSMSPEYPFSIRAFMMN
jgi:hypothetical protein